MVKTVLVTGSSRGIGLAIALKFYENGFNVVFNCKNSVKAMISNTKGLDRDRILTVKCDVSCFDEVYNMRKEILAKFGEVDVLVNNAAISYVGLFSEMATNDWDFIIKNNLYSVFNCCNVFSKDMIKNKSGIIINISSFWGENGASCESVYSASKGAVNSFTKSLAKELALSSIRVNAVSCGAIETSMNDFMSDDVRTDFSSQIAMGRFGKTYEVANSVYFLASSESSYITGHVLSVDGGN